MISDMTKYYADEKIVKPAKYWDRVENEINDKNEDLGVGARSWVKVLILKRVETGYFIDLYELFWSFSKFLNFFGCLKFNFLSVFPRF